VTEERTAGRPPAISPVGGPHRIPLHSGVAGVDRGPHA
jgi:hypothetical protein